MILRWLFSPGAPPPPQDEPARLPVRLLDEIGDIYLDTRIVPPYGVLRAMYAAAEEIENNYPADAVQDPVLGALLLAFGHMFRRIPAAYMSTPQEFMEAHERKTQPALTVPLYEIIDVGRAILDIWSAFDRLREYDLLWELRKRLKDNEAMVHKVPARELYAKLRPLPHELGVEPKKLAADFLYETPFAEFMRTEVPFRIPRGTWSSHGIIIAPPRFGKSQILGSFLRDALEDPDPRAIILLDPHGDLFRKAKKRLPPERLVVIDPDTNPPALNLMDFGTLSHFEALEAFKFLMSSLAGGLSPKQETCIPSLFELLKKIEGANFVTLHQIITEKALKGRPLKFADAIEQLDDEHRDFFHNLFYSGNFQETRDALQWKMLAALGRPAFKQMFSAKRNSIDMDRYIRERKVVLVKGGENALGKEGMRIFLLFLVSQYFAAGKRRDQIPEHQRHLAMMFVDEAHTVLQSPIISDILVELRKYECAFIAATQVWHQVAEDVRPAMLGATAIKIVGAIQHNDAMILSREMFCDHTFIRSLKAVPALSC